ncbi:MAG: hypothetical protein M0025_06745 [Elusimicrobia bacterium]|nr:hypothetical protein [Elusimicrobiota bacterium]
MLKLLSSFLLLAAAGPAFSFDLPSIGLSALKTGGDAPVVVPAASRAASQYVWMSVRNNPSFKEAQADDWSARIETRVRESFKDSYDVSMRTDMDSAWASIRKSGSFYNMSGSGLYLTMSGSGSSYFISGNVSENGKTSFVSVSVSKRFDDYSYSVFGSGLNLYTDRNSVNGSYDPDQVSKKAVAAVSSLILALQVEKGEPRPQDKSADLSQRIWLTIGPGFGGWNTVEARDPWARIEVGLRKVFDREYDSDIAVDNGARQWGRVSGFFTGRYELTAGRTSLRMEEWAGRWEITGTVEVNRPGQDSAGVKLEMRDRFGDGSFDIWEDGIRLTIDRNAINGAVDPKTYPKEVVAAIASLVMAYQQDKPNPAQQGSPR